MDQIQSGQHWSAVTGNEAYLNLPSMQTQSMFTAEHPKEKTNYTMPGGKPVSDGETKAINYYVESPQSWDVNEYLREDEQHFAATQESITANLMISAIEKQPYMPAGETLWRGVRGSAAEDARMLVVGDVIADKGFTSATYQMSHTAPFQELGSNNRIAYRIVTSGVEKAIPGSRKESEMIFAPNTGFRVIGIDQTRVATLSHPKEGLITQKIITVTGVK
jgi:hypothetical protein